MKNNYGTMENGFFEKVKMDKFDIITLDNKEDIYLSGVIGVDTVGGAEYRWQLKEFLSDNILDKIKKEVRNNFNERRKRGA